MSTRGSIAGSGIGQDKFQEWLSRIPARRSVLLYDTCESGTLTGPGIATRGLERVAAMAKMTRAMGRTVLAASTDDAPALERFSGAWRLDMPAFVRSPLSERSNSASAPMM